MNHIEWVVGQKYLINDIMSQDEGELLGFIQNQIPVRWKNQESYRNHSNRTIYLVLKYESKHYEAGKIRYVLALPQLGGWLSACMDSNPYSSILLQGIEYGDSIEQLIKKLQENWVFTPKLTYAATYKENFNYLTDVNWKPKN
jgi:hypothetical protein